MTTSTFESAVLDQIHLLNVGQPLQAVDRYFALDGLMYSNDTLFASDKDQARQKQERYILAAQSISGRIEELKIDTTRQICIFRNRTRFVLGDSNEHQIDGLCWQKWSGSKIQMERYFDGAVMDDLLLRGVLHDPSKLAPIAE